VHKLSWSRASLLLMSSPQRCTTLPSFFVKIAKPCQQHTMLICHLLVQDFKHCLLWQSCWFCFDQHLPVCEPIICPTMANPSPSCLSAVGDNLMALLVMGAAPVTLCLPASNHTLMHPAPFLCCRVFAPLCSTLFSISSTLLDLSCLRKGQLTWWPRQMMQSFLIISGVAALPSHLDALFCHLHGAPLVKVRNVRCKSEGANTETWPHHGWATPVPQGGILVHVAHV